MNVFFIRKKNRLKSRPQTHQRGGILHQLIEQIKRSLAAGQRPRLIAQQQGFSLVEILIGLTLLAIIGGIVGTKVLESLSEGQQQSAVIQMQNIASALKDYRRTCNAYPTSEQGLQALLSEPTVGRKCTRYRAGGYLDDDAVPRDPWDTEYFYESDGRSFTLKSYGADQIEGGEGFDQDIIHGETLQ